jgi:hypothetical protein
MTAAASLLHRTSLQNSRACLGICRHCLESTTPEQPCHTDLNDTIVALEIAIVLLETRSEHAYDRLCYCAKVCEASVAKWGHSEHPSCRQSAGACQTFVDFWREAVVVKGRELNKT